MMQHLKIRNIVAAAVVCLVGLGFARAQAGPSDVARVSFVQGSVQLLTGQGTDFQQAVINMPVLDGSRLQAGGEGQAEIEFGDGSVARLTPNSAVAFPHLGQDQAQIQQLSGLAYYEFNVGDGHPPFSVQFGNETVQPTTNSILRVGLDAGWDVAVISGAVQVQGDGIPGVAVSENQSIRSGADNSGAPYVVAQGINGDSWDNWNQDRDQAIAQEASQQTPVRDDSANPQNENWNDLDADGNWYPVEGAGNVWVPGGVGPGWDPYGAGYWAYYPTYGYTWVSSYPWGWLPYHCGAWNYYSFGWGWAPGGCGGWSPVIVVRGHPPGWRMPVPPIRPPGGIHPVGGLRLVAVDRGPVATGPWRLNSGFRPTCGSSAGLELQRAGSDAGGEDRGSSGICRGQGHGSGVARSVGWRRTGSSAAKSCQLVCVGRQSSACGGKPQWPSGSRPDAAPQCGLSSGTGAGLQPALDVCIAAYA